MSEVYVLFWCEEFDHLEGLFASLAGAQEYSARLFVRGGVQKNLVWVQKDETTWTAPCDSVSDYRIERTRVRP